MLPQPNFGRDKGPIEPEKDANGEGAMPRKKLLRLQIAMWIQVVCAVLAGNLLAMTTISARGASLADIKANYENPDFVGPTGTPQGDFDYYQSPGFLGLYLTIAGITLLAAIVGALCAIRFKSRLKAVRWSAVVATAILFVIGMLMSVGVGLIVAPWVFASVFALWWLFASDIRYWLNRRGGDKLTED
ncbi:hypothetical protein [Glycomyces rhizosphaerae]|uniref:DUF4064 domain-containing protein n=1 Tax=Glycomyces rhizosphaerae TaxID=2054422 RepID=A0ABV7Q3X8_9ACTN